MWVTCLSICGYVGVSATYSISVCLQIIRPYRPNRQPDCQSLGLNERDTELSGGVL